MEQFISTGLVWNGMSWEENCELFEHLALFWEVLRIVYKTQSKKKIQIRPCSNLLERERSCASKLNCELDDLGRTPENLNPIKDARQR